MIISGWTEVQQQPKDSWFKIQMYLILHQCTSTDIFVKETSIKTIYDR